jgi:hypothetical protein
MEKFGRGFWKFFTRCAEVYEVLTRTVVLALAILHAISMLIATRQTVHHSYTLYPCSRHPPPATMHPQHSSTLITIITLYQLN